MTVLGVTFPQTEIGADPAVIRDWALAVEAMGFSYVLVYDHVLGAKPGHPSLAGTRYNFTHQSLIHEPFVLFGYLAALTRRVELVSGILILPQRQTALVAKQAAEVDVLSGGRLRLGVGLGWNRVEFEALGEDFHNRGRRVEEQVEVLRLLWTEELVTYHGTWHTIDDVGIHPRPVQQPIPIWIGAQNDRAVERAGRISDGWLALGPPDAENERRAALLREAAARAGRDPTTLQIAGTLGLRGNLTPDDWRGDAEAWQRLGATHVTVNTLNAGLPTVEAHLEALDRARQTLGPLFA